MPQDEQIDDCGDNGDGTVRPTVTAIDWYAIGQTRILQVGDMRIRIRVVSRKGRKVRIAVETPPTLSRFSGGLAD